MSSWPEPFRSARPHSVTRSPRFGVVAGAGARRAILPADATRSRTDVMRDLVWLRLFRRRPTLPGGFPPSTIGAGGLNFRVRDGNGCDSAAMATGNLGVLSRY